VQEGRRYRNSICELLERSADGCVGKATAQDSGLSE
jgi:hypothetical protein